jgi:hypothetical protein
MPNQNQMYHNNLQNSWSFQVLVNEPFTKVLNILYQETNMNEGNSRFIETLVQ